MPCRRIGRSTSTTPWSKSISITRSAITHSRPIETCWKAEIVHSCPSTVLAPISHSPSWTRIFVPWPSQDQRPSRSTASRPISSLTSGRDEAQAVGLQALAPAQLQPRPARDQPGVVEVEHPVAAHEARERQRTAVQRFGHAVDRRRGSGPGHRRHRPTETILRRLMADSLAERLLRGDKRALARGISLVEDDDPDGLGRSSRRSTRTPATRRSSASPARPAPASRR